MGNDLKNCKQKYLEQIHFPEKKVERFFSVESLIFIVKPQIPFIPC